MLKQTYYPPVGQRRFWRLADAMPGRRILAAIWSWM